MLDQLLEMDEASKLLTINDEKELAKEKAAREKAVKEKAAKEKAGTKAADKERPAASNSITPARRPYRARKLKPRIVSEFQIVVQKPFVVIGDESLGAIQRHAQGTIKWAVDRLKQDYFPLDPDHVINIWLFKDKVSYEQNNVDLFRSRPHTPFGYYSPGNRVLVMNIDTGGGTLVHEIVHPFMAANFPDCPSWLNEGMGSLYEQCQDNNGHIWGLTNWRLRGLHEALKDEEYEMPTFEQLCGTTTREFYNEDPGTNYAQARYLCYYLQQHGLLVKFYHQFRAAVKEDPTGYATLKSVLEEDDMEAFQETWKEFVLELRF